ncbi:MAG: UTP--glucose-1-phosphate uridylyltransferase [Kiritimatiellia bacterium]
MKALIPAAGYGTRFLPASKTVPKEMLPIGAKPAIQLIVEEALDAGVEEVVIVTSPDKPSLKRHFDVDAVWRARCAKKPAIDAELARLEAIGRRIRWVGQTEQKGLGHAVLQAAPLLASETEPVLILLGDALVSGEAPSRAMTEISRLQAAASVVGLEEVPVEKVSRYGIVAGEPLPLPEFLRSPAARLFRLSDLVEKPAPEAAPSRLAIAGRYLLDAAIFDLLATQPPGAGGEIQLTDAIRRLLADRPVFGYRYPGRRHDIGNPQGYFETLQAFQSARHLG